MEENNTFSIRMKEARTQKEISLAELSRITEIAPATLSSYEKGKQPTVGKAMIIAQTLGVSLDWLCGNDDGESSEITIEEVMNAIIVLSKLSCTDFETHYEYFNNSIVNEDYSIKFSGSIIEFIREYEKILDFMKNPEYPEYLKTGLKETLMSNFKAKYHIKNGQIRRNDFSDVDYEEILDDGEVPF